MSKMMIAADLECRDTEFQISHAPASRTNGKAPRFSNRLSGLLASLAETSDIWIERLQQRRELAELDSRMLDDIGLDKAAVERELAKPFWRR